MRPKSLDLGIAVLGIFVSLAMVLMKFLPFVPGHFTISEYIALCAWGLLGLLLNALSKRKLPISHSGA
jgi:hypothetical protein